MSRPLKLTFKDYPKPFAYRGGCKVDWYYYQTEDEARVASKAAYHNRDIMRDQGYEWGYQSPGGVELVKDGPHAGLWEVVIP